VPVRLTSYGDDGLGVGRSGIRRQGLRRTRAQTKRHQNSNGKPTAFTRATLEFVTITVKMNQPRRGIRQTEACSAGALACAPR
jgi:hypothetical protein